ncbi:MAG: MBOAT family protein [Planctomycetia bacterium]|nr:MBOAT family protein [Planctomycetia bacterium]
MNFPTTQFLGFFLTVFAVYWLLPWHRARMVWLLLASCAFYMSWHPWLILLILLSASVDYVVALLFDDVKSLTWGRLLLFGSIGFNLSLLAFFKYTNFMLDSANSMFALLGVEYRSPLFDNLLLPLGISFYTFETISYVVDVYMGRFRAVRNPIDYALYIMFFPHLAAGPIVRPRDFLPQVERRKRFDWYRLVVGMQIALVGLFKKAVIADHMPPVVDPVFKCPELYSSASIWLATLAYTVQIYCDFSGYSDMAMGMAHMLGFKLPVNFHMPYFAASITEFWRRWHISLSSWLRDYLYVPLGGNRGGKLATYRNLMITMLLGGLWHGASWTFVFWGAYHGALLSLHRAFGRGAQADTAGGVVGVSRHVVCVLATFLSVCIGWVFFRAQTFGDAGTVVTRLVWPTVGLNLHPGHVLLVGLSVLAVFLGHLAGTFLSWRRLERRLPAPALGGALAFLLLLALLLMPEASKGFIYFQF